MNLYVNIPIKKFILLNDQNLADYIRLPDYIEKKKGYWTDSDSEICESNRVRITGALWWNMD